MPKKKARSTATSARIKKIPKPRSHKEVGEGRDWRPELPIWLFLVMAVLSVPRVIAHDSHIVDLDSAPYIALAVIPLLLYAAIAITLKTWRPFYNFMVLGVFLGLALAITHQLMWDISWSNNPPEIGGNLKDTFDPATEELILRAFTFISSVVTGLVMGVVFGVIAIIAQRIRLAAGKM